MSSNVFMLAAAAVLILAHSARAGDFNQKLIVSIPFAFHTTNGVIEAGSYEVLYGNGALVGLRDQSTSRLVLATAHRSVESLHVKPVMEFVCGEGEPCWLKEIRSGIERYTFLPPGNARSAERRKLYTVTVPLRGGRTTN